MPDSSSSRQKTTTTTTTEDYHIQRLLQGAPPGSIKQTINVEREEEEIIGPLPDDGQGPDGLLNFDTVSEKVDLGLEDGKALVGVKVRCERIVPIRGVEDMFKKSSVIVTRLITIDLMVTEERRRLWYAIMQGSSKPAIKAGEEGSRHPKYDYRNPKLSTKQTFNLYKTFMGLAEADEAGKQGERVQIDRRVEDERRPDLNDAKRAMDAGLNPADMEFDTAQLDAQLEQRIGANSHRHPEPDTMSFVSASETHDMLY